MKNRSIEFFNLSFLDLLSGALASVIFLFIIVPKGEITIYDSPVAITYDTLQKQFYGVIPDSMMGKQPGDTILAILSDFEHRPEAVASTANPEPRPPVRERPRSESRDTPEEKQDEPKEEREETPQVTIPASKFTGSKPDVPCVLSIEMKWGSKKDNVDLFVCKSNDCVYGARRSREDIGFWDSGKARTSIFGGDLRTNQEAVRQFDQIMPGTYEILAQYKESDAPKTEMPIRLQVYTKNDDGVEHGKEHYFKLNINPTDRVRIATVTVGANGAIEFQSFK